MGCWRRAASSAPKLKLPLFVRKPDALEPVLSKLKLPLLVRKPDAVESVLFRGSSSVSSSPLKSKRESPKGAGGGTSGCADYKERCQSIQVSWIGRGITPTSTTMLPNNEDNPPSDEGGGSCCCPLLTTVKPSSSPPEDWGCVSWATPPPVGGASSRRLLSPCLPPLCSVPSSPSE